MNRYVLPSDILAGISVEIGSIDPFVGIITSFSIRANGVHAVLPYALYSGGGYNTYSVIRSNNGELSFSGILMNDVTNLQSLLTMFADMQSSAATTLSLSTLDSPPDLLISWNIYDFRLSAVRLEARNFGNTGMVLGDFAATFRKLVQAT